MPDTDLLADLEQLLRNGWLVPGALVVVERSARGPGLAWPDGYTSVKDRSYGDTALWWSRPAEPSAD